MFGALLLGFGIGVAQGATVAVLPLEQGAGSESYAGLGKALAGMVVTDLSRVEGLVLVERQRLDAVLGELALSGTAFVDGATAQELGKGLGAELLVVGDYSVVGQTFLMSARLVHVESGEVRAAADSQGTVADFVAVEKGVVGALLGGLSASAAARREALEQAPTHSFQALQAYGEGLDAQDAGREQEAREAFAEAVREDPGFVLARSELGALRLLLEARIAEERRQKDAARAAILDRVLAEVPAPSALPAGRWSGDDVVGLALRWQVLDELGQSCARAEEMRAYLDEMGWKPRYPAKDYHRTVAAIVDRGVGFGLYASAKQSPQDHASAEFAVQTGPAPRFGDVGAFLYGFPGLDLNVPSSFDFLHATVACLEPAERPAAIAEIREQVVARGLGDVIVARDLPDVGLAERLELTALFLKVELDGVDAETTAAWAAAVERHASAPETHAWLLRAGEQLARRGEAVERRRAARIGMTEAQLDRLLDVIAAKDPALLRLDDALCAGLVEGQARWAESLLAQRAARGAAWVPSAMGAGSLAAPLRDMGCIVGVAGRFEGPDQARAWVASARSRERPEMGATCAAAWKELPERSAEPATGAWAPWQVSAMLLWYHGQLVQPLCVTE